MSNRPDLDAIRQSKGNFDEGNEERIASILEEIQHFRDEIRKNNAEKEQVGFHFSYFEIYYLSFEVHRFSSCCNFYHVKREMLSLLEQLLVK